MNVALETLFYPFQTGVLEPQGLTLFLNAQNHPALSAFSDIHLQQYFKPYASNLDFAGFDVLPDIPDHKEFYDYVLLVVPKNQAETLYMLARALSALKPGGLVVAAASNKAGGSRLSKNLAQFVSTPIRAEARNKCRVVWAAKDAADQKAIEKAVQDGGPQNILDGQFQSCPGIFGWNKKDLGSEILLQHLPADLNGAGADFGCGYGLLAQHILQHYTLKNFSCIDADWRAVEMCRINLQSLKSNNAVDFHWQDLTKSGPDNLDFIVMNPPFHEGKMMDISIGEAFIKQAAQSLKPGGRLFMVANRKLPYEPALQHNFSLFKNIFEGQGFKVFCAAK